MASRLPADIICLVIEHTDDTDTLDAWCSATVTDIYLHQFALHIRWAATTITQDDFLSHSDDSLPRHRSTISLATSQEGHRTPASLIKHLRLWFQFRAPGKTTPPDEYHEGWIYEQLPCSEDLDYSLRTLIPQCINIERIDHDGVLHQENLNEICKVAHTPLRRLRLRMTRPDFPARYRDPPPHQGLLRNGRDDTGRISNWGHNDHCCLDWTNIGQLKDLTHFEMGQLWMPWDEATTVAKAVEQLKNLQTLSISTAKLPLRWAFWMGYPSVLREFCSYVFSIDTNGMTGGCKLSRALRSLTLSESRARCVPIPRRPEWLPRVSFPALTDIYLNLEDHSALKTLFDWLELPSLARVSIPRVISRPLAQDRMVNSSNDVWGPPATTSSSAMAALINSIIQGHRATLQQIILLNTWQHGWRDEGVLQELESDWEGSFTPQELVFGTQPPRHIVEESSMDGPPCVGMQRDCSLYRVAMDRGYLQHTLRRLRIDQVEFFDDFIGAMFAEADFEKLRIVMLYPWLDINSRSAMTLDKPNDLALFPEGQVALRVTECNSTPELRILVIGGYKFWVEHISYDVETALPPLLERTKTWHLQEALRDTCQRAQIGQHLSQRDWDFINDLPDHPKVQDPRAEKASGSNKHNYLFKSRPTHEMFKERNLTVLHRGDYTGPLEPHDPAMRYRMNHASWYDYIDFC